ncbi:MAG: hypothetical protein ACOC0P_04265 [Planctomycetota bacterium]
MENQQGSQRSSNAVPEGTIQPASPTSIPWAIVGTLPCLGCEYDLKGLEGPRVTCPECRHVNDLRDAQPWLEKLFPRGVRERLYWPGHATGVGGLGLILLLTGMPFFIGFRFSSFIDLLMSLVAIVVLAISGWCLYRTYRLAQDYVRSCRRRMYGSLLFVLYDISIFTVVICFFWGINRISDATTNRVDVMATFQWGDVRFALPFIASIIMLRLSRWLILRGEHTGLYRENPAEFKLPLAATYTPDEDGTTRS